MEQCGKKINKLFQEEKTGSWKNNWNEQSDKEQKYKPNNNSKKFCIYYAHIEFVVYIAYVSFMMFYHP